MAAKKTTTKTGGTSKKTTAESAAPADDATGDTTGGDATGGAATATPAVTTALNQQIVQAVDKTNQVVLGAAGTEANGVSYQKVAQAAAFSVQDSTDYLRNVMTMAATAQGVCLQLMIAEKTTDPYATIMKDAQAAVTASQENFAAVGTASAAVVNAFPSS